MVSKAVGIYRSVLYLSKFIVDDKVVEDQVRNIPKLLTTLHVKDDNIRVAVIDRIKLVISDLRELELTADEKDISRASKKFVKVWLIVFGTLLNLSCFKALFIQLTKHRTITNNMVNSFSVKIIAKLSVCIASLSSLVPLVNKYLVRVLPTLRTSLPLATFLTAFPAITLLPEGAPKDLVSAYTFAYALESYLNFINARLNLGISSCWFLLPISVGELYHNFIIHPDSVPTSLKKIFDWLLKGLFETKPKMLAEAYNWPTVSESLVKIRRLSIEKTDLHINRGLIAIRNVGSGTYGAIVRYLPNPSHTFKILSLVNPSNPSLLNVLFRYIPKRFALLTLALIPWFLMKKHFYVKWHMDNEVTMKELVLVSLKSATKLAISLTLTTASAFALTIISSHYTRAQIRHFRIIGAISSLWFLVFYGKNDFPKPLLTYLTRVTFLGTKGKLAKKHPHIDLKLLNSLLGSVGLGILAGLWEKEELKKFISPSRIANYLSLIVTN